MRGIDGDQLQQLARCDLSEGVVTLGAFCEMCRLAGGRGRYSAVPPVGWPVALRTVLGAIYFVALLLALAGFASRLTAYAGLALLPHWVSNAALAFLTIALVAHLPIYIAGLITVDSAIERSVARLLQGQCPLCRYQMGEQIPDATARATVATCPECGGVAVICATPDGGATI